MTENILTHEDQKVQSDGVLLIEDEFWGDMAEERSYAVRKRGQIGSEQKKEWLIQNVIGPKDIVFFYGQPSTGKTFIIIDLLMSAIAGKSFANRFETTRPLNVAMIVGEGGRSIDDRFVAADHYHCVPAEFNYDIFDNGLQFYEDNDGAEIERFVYEWKRFENRQLDILIVDTYAMATIGANENDAKSAGKVLSNARAIANELGCAVIFVHHTTKNGSAERGSSALRAAADMMIEVSDKKITCTKAKHCAAWAPVGFELMTFEDSLVVKWAEQMELSDAITSFVAKSDSKVVMADIIEAFKNVTSHTTVRSTVKKLVDDGLLHSRLRNPDTVPSKSNPTIYFLNSNETTELTEDW